MHEIFAAAVALSGIGVFLACIFGFMRSAKAGDAIMNKQFEDQMHDLSKRRK